MDIKLKEGNQDKKEEALKLGEKFAKSLLAVDPPPPLNVTLLKDIAFPYDADDLATALEETKKPSTFWNKAFTSWSIGAEMVWSKKKWRRDGIESTCGRKPVHL